MDMNTTESAELLKRGEKHFAGVGTLCARKRIGFVSIWFERGQSYVTKILRDVLAAEHKTFVFARSGAVFGQTKLETEGFWAVPNLTTHADYQIPAGRLCEWIRTNRLDAVVFNEEYDWRLVQAAKDTGVKVLTYLDYYKDEWAPLMRLYDAVLCSSRRSFDMLKEVCQAYYIGWGIDTDLFRPEDGPGGKFTFFHNAGWLGINYRKMTPAVILAFDALSRRLPDATLLIHAQVGIEKLPAEAAAIVRRNRRITYRIATVPAPGLYHEGRILLFPTKLEGLGLPLLEGLACGLPAIATDAPPMNEFVRDGVTGLLVRVAQKIERTDRIAFPETLVDVNDLSYKMAIMAAIPEQVAVMSNNARSYAQENLSLAGLASRIRPCMQRLFENRVPSSQRPSPNGRRLSSPDAAPQTGRHRVVITTHFSPAAEDTVRALCKGRGDVVGILLQRPPNGTDGGLEARKRRLQQELLSCGKDSVAWAETSDIDGPESEAILSRWRPGILLTIEGRMLNQNRLGVPSTGDGLGLH